MKSQRKPTFMVSDIKNCWLYILRAYVLSVPLKSVNGLAILQTVGGLVRGKQLKDAKRTVLTVDQITLEPTNTWRRQRQTLLLSRSV